MSVGHMHRNGNEPNRIFAALREIDGLVLAFIGFMILWAFAALDITIPFLWNAVFAALIIIAVIVYYVFIKKNRKG